MNGAARRACAAQRVFRDRATVRQRMEAVSGLPRADQFRLLHGELVAADAEGGRVRQQLNSLQTGQKSGEHIAEFFARTAGYIPEEAGEQALAMLPDASQRSRLFQDVRLVTDPISKGSELSQKRAGNLADVLLQQASQLDRITEDTNDPDLRRVVFNTRLMLALRNRGHSTGTLSHLLSPDGTTVSQRNTVRLGGRLLRYPQETDMRDVDTVSDTLSLLGQEEGEYLAREFFRTYKNRQTAKRSIWKVTDRDELRRETHAQGRIRSGRATAEMLMRALGVRDADELRQDQEQELHELLEMVDLMPGSAGERREGEQVVDAGRVMDGLLRARGTFKSLLYLEEARKRGPK